MIAGPEVDTTRLKAIDLFDCTTGKFVTHMVDDDGLRQIRNRLFQRTMTATCDPSTKEELYDEALKHIDDTVRYMGWMLTEPSIFGHLLSQCVLDYIDTLDSPPEVKKTARRILNIIERRDGYAMLCISNNNYVQWRSAQIAAELVSDCRRPA